MAKSPALADPPDRSVISRLLNRWAVVDLKPAAHVADPDRAALENLVDASGWIDRLYWQQRSSQGLALKEMLHTAAGRNSRELARLVNIGYGPWDVLDDDKPFWGT